MTEQSERDSFRNINPAFWSMEWYLNFKFVPSIKYDSSPLKSFYAKRHTLLYMIFSMRCGADLIPLYCQWSTLSKFKNTCNRPLSWTFSCTRSTRYSEGRMQSGPFCWWPTAYSLVRFAEGWPHTIWSLLLRADRIQFYPFCWGLTAYSQACYAAGWPHTVCMVLSKNWIQITHWAWLNSYTMRSALDCCKYMHARNLCFPPKEYILL